MSAEKRPNSPDKSDDDSWIGPMPSEAVKTKPKKRKGMKQILYVKLTNLSIMNYYYSY